MTFRERFESQTKGLTHLSVGPCEDCAECEDFPRYEGELLDEGSFSWFSCETCSPSRAGTRWAAHAVLNDTEVSYQKLNDGRLIHLDVCTDCLMYIANGEEPEGN